MVCVSIFNLTAKLQKFKLKKISSKDAEKIFHHKRKILIFKYLMAFI